MTLGRRNLPSRAAAQPGGGGGVRAVPRTCLFRVYLHRYGCCVRCQPTHGAAGATQTWHSHQPSPSSCQTSPPTPRANRSCRQLCACVPRVKGRLTHPSRKVASASRRGQAAAVPPPDTHEGERGLPRCLQDEGQASLLQTRPFQSSDTMGMLVKRASLGLPAARSPGPRRTCSIEEHNAPEGSSSWLFGRFFP